MLEKVYEDTERKMTSAIDHLAKELAGVRTGRASTALLEGIAVDYYGTPTPLNQMATLSVPEGSLITVQPWDRTMLAAMEKAIQASSLGLTPSNDGTVIRIPIPPLSGERRQELVKHVKKLAEDGKVAVRNVRRSANEELKKAQSKSEITEDDLHKAQDKVQNSTNGFVEKIDKILADKEKEILED